MSALVQPATERVARLRWGEGSCLLSAETRATPRHRPTRLEYPLMAKRDYYETLGLSRGASEQDIKSAFRRLAKDCHPDRHPRRQDCRAEVQGAERGLRGLERSAKARGLRPVRPRRIRRPPRARRGRLRSGLRLVDVRHLRRSVRRVHGRTARRATASARGRERGADLRYNMEITLEEAFAGKTAQIRVPTSVTCETCNGSGAKTGTQPIACPTCGGVGKVRAAKASSPSSAPVPPVRGAARSSTTPAPPAPERDAWSRSARYRSTSHPASTTARASASPAKARRACAADRPAISTSSSPSSRTSSSSATAPTSSAAYRSP